MARVTLFSYLHSYSSHLINSCSTELACDKGSQPHAFTLADLILIATPFYLTFISSRPFIFPAAKSSLYFRIPLWMIAYLLSFDCISSAKNSLQNVKRRTSDVISELVYCACNARQIRIRDLFNCCTFLDHLFEIWARMDIYALSWSFSAHFL